MIRRLSVVLTMATAVMGCGEEVTFGPCVHSYLDPVLSIVEVTDAETGAAVSPIRVLDIHWGTIRHNPAFLVQGPAYSVTEIGGGLLCEVDCGFGTDEGVYSFRIEADGYQALPIEITASYADFSPGCPSSNSNGTEIRVELTGSG